MNWAYELTADAQQDLADLPKAIQKRVARVAAQMAATDEPFQGDVKALRGDEWKGVFRRRIGDYRILFTVDQEHKLIRVLRILLRSGKTYR
ncbi:MAG: type II toxin-antitoxin system RelE family toxin [Bryobacteraceae bacterium]